MARKRYIAINNQGQLEKAARDWRRKRHSTRLREQPDCAILSSTCKDRLNPNYLAAASLDSYHSATRCSRLARYFARSNVPLRSETCAQSPAYDAAANMSHDRLHIANWEWCQFAATGLTFDRATPPHLVINFK